MKKSLFIRSISIFVLLAGVCVCSGCGQKEDKRARQEIIEEMVVDYETYDIHELPPLN